MAPLFLISTTPPVSQMRKAGSLKHDKSQEALFLARRRRARRILSTRLVLPPFSVVDVLDKHGSRCRDRPYFVRLYEMDYGGVASRRYQSFSNTVHSLDIEKEEPSIAVGTPILSPR
ncbi:hypothetical protein NEUTE1DRAFT_107240 [Neurospora tetrasperma FGSC 2508]|uniref:Uncharacterized protein n=1 Tax=Neurospora tetrasperma (strain FGSC 2508 / ATCC MYA-4615 / P0657) TaxID=510951 RepID=F8MDJ2_NEUT8|nr:uncharacterized protein NEUTE1DRAFT_107240 [Neurospora tetrasperma FGSC 2508]EGO60630.1 hypothetical protein NEUTE1DRAFT_107240 [Neurospora tetrasperma FGSC 2508]